MFSRLPFARLHAASLPLLTAVPCVSRTQNFFEADNSINMSTPGVKTLFASGLSSPTGPVSSFRLLVGALSLLAFLNSAPATAQVYQLDNVSSNREQFNNSAGSETEDNWVANSFVAAQGMNQLASITFEYAGNLGQAASNLPVTTALYTGSSLTDPRAGGGLIRIVGATNTVSVSSASNSFVTIPFATPIDMPAGQIFYAALLIRGVSGNLLPFTDDHRTSPGISPTFLQRSFFDVGPTQSGPYNLDNTINATVLGGTHPVVGSSIQAAGNLVLRVNALTPEPGTLTLLGAFALSGIGFARRRQRR